MIDHDIVFPFSAGLILAQYYFLLKGKCRTSNSKNSRALNESLSVKPAVTMLKKKKKTALSTTCFVFIPCI